MKAAARHAITELAGAWERIELARQHVSSAPELADVYFELLRLRDHVDQVRTKLRDIEAAS